MSQRATRGALIIGSIVLEAVVACGSDSSAPIVAANHAGSSGNAGSAASAGVATAGMSNGGSNPSAAGGAAATAGVGGGASGGVSGSGAAAGSGGVAGSSVEATAGGAGLGTAGSGVFVACDDHADFNGRGRCASTGKVGAVLAFEDLSAGASVTSLTAVFGTTTPPSELGCAQAAVGAGCVALTCPRPAGASPAAAAAGSISAKSVGGTFTTSPGANGVYDVAQFGQTLWAAKAALAFSAAGGAIAAFGETFCGPTPVAMTEPAGVPGAGLTIDRSADLSLKWLSANVGDLQLVLRDDSSVAGSSVEVQCSFTASSGQGTIPKAALAKIGAGLHHAASYLWVRKIGGGGSGSCIELTAIMTNNASTGAPFNGSALFQ